MKKLCGIIFILMLGVTISGCSGCGVSKKDAGRVWDEYINLKVADMGSGLNTNDAVLQNNAARKYQFDSWGSFVNKSVESLGTEKWNALAQDKSKQLALQIVASINEKKLKEAEVKAETKPATKAKKK